MEIDENSIQSSGTISLMTHLCCTEVLFAQSTAKIEPLSNAPKIFKKVSKTSKCPKVGDLPQEARAIWRFFKVVIVDAAGQLGPWEDVPDHTIEKTWNAIFENKGSCLIGRTTYRGRDEHELFQIVKALVRMTLLPFSLSRL